MDDVANAEAASRRAAAPARRRRSRTALYLGDNVDDALAAQRARVPFLGVLPRGSEARTHAREAVARHGARAILHSASELEKWL